MKKTTLISAAVFAYCILLTAYSFSQGTAINSTGTAADGSAMLDVSSTTHGMLVPRMTESEKNLITNPANGLMIYQTDNTTGFWYYDSGAASWKTVGGGAGGSSYIYYGDATGSSNNFNVTVTPSATSYFKGMVVNFESNQCITGPATVNVSGLGAISIKKNIAVDLQEYDISTGQIVSVIYDGSNFQLLVPAPSTGPAYNSYAGNDVNTDQTTVTLDGEYSYYTYDRVRWSVTSGAGGSFADINDPFTDFTGVAGTNYVLRLTTYNQCDSVYDEVNINISAPVTKRVFVTSVDYNGDMGGPAGADNKCQTLANNAALGGTFKAWVSCSTVDAKNRIGSGGWKRIDDVFVAGNITDLTDGSILNAINVDENGNTRNGVYVWTATDNNGNWSNWLTACSCWASSSGSDRTHLGITSSTSQWSLNFYNYCNLPYALYCFEQ